MFDKAELENAKTIIDSLVEIHPPAEAGLAPITFSQKLDRLAELIDAVRFHTGFEEDDAEAKVFHPTNVLADPGSCRIHFIPDDNPPEPLDDEASKKLSVALLDFLFTHPGHGRSVLPTIRSFVRSWLPHARMIDFQRTSTGVLRIVTNTRFAAHELRKNGLLQYTPSEAFKQWRLSLLGILVADEFSASPAPERQSKATPYWQTVICGRLAVLESLPQRILRLENLVKAAAMPSQRRNAFLEKTMRLLSDYAGVLRSLEADSEGLNRVKASSKISDLLAQLNTSPEAAIVVDAFDPAPDGQGRLL